MIISKSRIGWLDIAKCFAILLVFLGHKTSNIYIEQYIYSFHLPFFFWISGFLFNPNKYPTFGSFLIRRLHTLVLPYFVFASISFLFWLFVVRPLSIRGQVHALNPFFPFWGIFYAVGVGHWRQPLDIALWFLPCLFVTEMLFYSINKRINGLALFGSVAICGIIGYCTSKWLPFRLPWSADVALTAVVFYFAGYITTRIEERMRNMPLYTKIWLIALLAVFSLLLSYFNGKIDMNYNLYGNPLLFYGAALAGIYLWYLLIRPLPSVRGLTYIGQNTIIIIGMAGISAFILRGFQYVLLHTLTTTEKFGLPESLLRTLLEILLLIPAIYLINRYTPFILGRKR